MSFQFWQRYLMVAVGATVAYGSFLAVRPDLATSMFSFMFFGDLDHIGAFPRGSVAYVEFLTAVLGSVLIGWGVTLLLVVHYPFKNHEPYAWNMVVMSILAWYVPDTIISVMTGFWQNAVMNTGFLVMFAIGLIPTRARPRGAGPA